MTKTSNYSKYMVWGSRRIGIHLSHVSPMFFWCFLWLIWDCRLSFTRSSWSWVIPPKCRHLHKRRPHIPALFIWGTSGETSGLLGDKVGITRGDKKGLGVKNNESVTISDLNNDGKGDFQCIRTLLKVKTLLFFWDVNFSEGGSRSFKVFDADVRICWKIFENDIGVASQSFKANTTKGSVDLLVEMWISWNFHKSWHWPFQNPTKTLQVSSSHER